MDQAAVYAHGFYLRMGFVEIHEGEYEWAANGSGLANESETFRVAETS